MKKLSSLFPLMLLLCLSSLAHAKETAAQIAARSAIVAAEARADRALMRKDIAAMSVDMAPDFQYFNLQRVASNRDQYLNGQRLILLPQVKMERVQTNVTKIEWRGPDAVVYTSGLVQLRGPKGVGVVRGTSREYWGKIGGRWMVRQVVELTGKATLNGQPFMQG